MRGSTFKTPGGISASAEQVKGSSKVPVMSETLIVKRCPHNKWHPVEWTGVVRIIFLSISLHYLNLTIVDSFTIYVMITLAKLQFLPLTVQCY